MLDLSSPRADFLPGGSGRDIGLGEGEKERTAADLCSGGCLPSSRLEVRIALHYNAIPWGAQVWKNN
jgi:hypothetical protein